MRSRLPARSGSDQPVEEAADLPEVAVAGLQGVAGEAAEVGVEMGGGDARDVAGEALFPSGCGEAAKGLAVGVKGVVRLALDTAGGEVEVDEVRERGCFGQPGSPSSTFFQKRQPLTG